MNQIIIKILRQIIQLITQVDSSFSVLWVRTMLAFLHIWREHPLPWRTCIFHVEFLNMQVSRCINRSKPDPGWIEKNNLNLYFSPFLWMHKRFSEGLKGLHETFWGTTNKRENKKSKLIFILIQIINLKFMVVNLYVLKRSCCKRQVGLVVNNRMLHLRFWRNKWVCFSRNSKKYCKCNRISKHRVIRWYIVQIYMIHGCYGQFQTHKSWTSKKCSHIAKLK